MVCCACCVHSQLAFCLAQLILRAWQLLHPRLAAVIEPRHLSHHATLALVALDIPLGAWLGHGNTSKTPDRCSKARPRRLRYMSADRRSASSRRLRSAFCCSRTAPSSAAAEHAHMGCGMQAGSDICRDAAG